MYPMSSKTQSTHEFNQKGICIHCGRSETAMRHFGWLACNSAASPQDSVENKPSPDDLSREQPKSPTRQTLDFIKASSEITRLQEILKKLNDKNELSKLVIPSGEMKYILPKEYIPAPPIVSYRGPTSKPQVTIPNGWPSPKPRRNGLARGWSNGYSFVRPKDKPGLCSLKIVNGTDRDAVVKMVSENKKDRDSNKVLCRFVYICAGKSITMEGVGMGDYWLFFCTGTYWDKASKAFKEPYAAQKFIEAMKFIQEYKEGGGQYSTNEVTLHPVVGGSARTGYIDQEEFDRLL